jgi:hypothetical protein
MHEIMGGFAVGLTFGALALLAYRGYLRWTSLQNPRRPEKIGGAWYYVVPEGEYQRLLTCRNLVRVSVARMREKPSTDGASPLAERRKEPRIKPREPWERHKDGRYDISPRNGGTLKPGS